MGPGRVADEVAGMGWVADERVGTGRVAEEGGARGRWVTRGGHVAGGSLTIGWGPCVWMTRGSRCSSRGVLY